jgi:hypothetical protein
VSILDVPITEGQSLIVGSAEPRYSDVGANTDHKEDRNELYPFHDACPFPETTRSDAVRAKELWGESTQDVDLPWFPR